MLQSITTTRFHKDIKLAKKRGKDLEKIFDIMCLLLEEKPLSPKHRDHWLTGKNYSNRRECHIGPDWLLVYKPLPEAIIFERTETHTDLFN